MLRKNGRYLIFFALGWLLFLPESGGLTAADGDFYVLKYEDAAVSPRAQVINLSERLKHLTRQSVVRRRNGKNREIFIELTNGRKRKPFTYVMDKRGNMRIILPDSYPKLLSRPAALPQLTGWYLFGYAGKDPDLERYFRNSWFVVGISRKLLGEMNRQRMPFTGYFPAAYALTSASRYPKLESLLDTPLLPEDTAMRLVYEEYCELLTAICIRNGLFRTGLLTALLDDLEKSPKRHDMAELFRRHTQTVLKKRFPVIFARAVSQADLKKAYEEWFRRELDELLNSSFLPASAEKLETVYLKATRFQSRQKKTKTDSHPPEVTGSLPELVRYYTRLEGPEKTAADMIGRLSRLTRAVPPDLRIPLSDVRDALQAFSHDPQDRTGRALLDAEHRFFRALERNLVLEKFLREAETACVSPSARYYLTFSLIDYENQAVNQPLRRLNDLLDRTEKEMTK